MKRFLLLAVLLAGCTVSKAPLPEADGDISDAIIARLDAIEKRLSDIEGKPDPVDPRPELEGLADETKQAWRQYAENYADMISGVIDEMNSDEQITIEAAVDKLAAGSFKSRRSAMDPVTMQLETTDRREFISKLSEYRKGIAWHSLAR